MELSMIAAIGKNNELGKNNALIWNIPNDLKFFREKTIGKIVVMGANTFHSIGKPLPKRENIVITHQDIDNVLIYKSIREFLLDYKNKKEEIFIIGGASIYKEFINYASKIYLTEIDASDSKADTFFPDFNKLLYEKIVLDKEEENGVKYTHVLYKKMTHTNYEY